MSTTARWRFAIAMLAWLGACGGDAKGAERQPVGARALVMLEAVPGAPQPESRDGELGTSRPLGANGVPVRGTARFTVTPDGVDLMVDILGCNADFNGYLIEIHAGDSCTGENLDGPIWNPPLGSGIAPLYCKNTGGVGKLFYARAHGDKAHWSVGGSAASNVAGHVLVIRDPGLGNAPLSCGAIVFEQASVADAGVSDAQRAPLPARAAVAGLCLTKLLAGASDTCPDRQALADCAGYHCDLASCLDQCTDYIACLGDQTDVCAAQCAMSAECSKCSGNMTQCLFGYCIDVVGCAPPPTPDGPCSKVEACCDTQGDFAPACHEVVGAAIKIGGDQTCVGVMMDWDFNTHLAVPCTWE